jgi:hypothetical protein
MLDEGGRTIRVAADRVDEMRLEFASRACRRRAASASRSSIDSFGTTEFLEREPPPRSKGAGGRFPSARARGARVHIAMARTRCSPGSSGGERRRAQAADQQPPSTAVGITKIAASVGR